MYSLDDGKTGDDIKMAPLSTSKIFMRFKDLFAVLKISSNFLFIRIKRKRYFS